MCKTKSFSNSGRIIEQKPAIIISKMKYIFKYFSIFLGLIDVLDRRERIMLCLCQMNVVYSGNLPSSLFTGDSCHTIPTRISAIEYFAIPFDASVELPPNGYKRLLKLSKFYLDLLHDSSLPSPEAVKGTLPIFRNVIVFEMVHGNFQKAINILEKLSSFCPYFSDLWMMLARYGRPLTVHVEVSFFKNITYMLEFSCSHYIAC